MLALPLAQFARMMKSNPKRDIDKEVDQKKYKGVYYRKWGKWVSEIRVPRTKERIWLGTYSTPQGAAAAHDIATYSLHGPLSFGSLNFPLMLPASARLDMTPSSIVREATDAGKAMDALMIRRSSSPLPPPDVNANENNAVQGVKIEIEEDETRSEGRGSSKSVDGY